MGRVATSTLPPGKIRFTTENNDRVICSLKVTPCCALCFVAWEDENMLALAVNGQLNG